MKTLFSLFGIGFARKVASPALGLLVCSALASFQALAETITINGNVGAAVCGNGSQPNGASPCSAAPNDNTVIVNNGIVSGNVDGGYAETGSGAAMAARNSVAINGGTLNSDVTGGYAGSFSGTATSTENSVTIGSGTVNARVFGGYAESNGASGATTATHNTVTISGSPTFGAGAILFGGYTYGTGAGDAWTGNTLNLKTTTPITVAGVRNFQYYNFYIPASMAAGDTMLNVTSAVDITGSTIRVGIDGAASALNGGDEIVLIHSTGGLTAPGLDGTHAQGIQGVANLFSFDLRVDPDNLYAIVTGQYRNDQVKALSEGQAAGLAFVGQAADLIMGSGLYNLLAATLRQELGLASFGAVSGGSSRYKTGSHVDVDGVSLLAGLGWRAAMDSGSLVAGGFFEAGWGNYDSYNDFDSAASVKGKGDTSYYGGGFLGRYEAPMGLYGEASLRAGRVETDFRSKDILNSGGDSTKYDTGTAYYGAHLGVGYIWTLSEKSSLDISSKFIWTHQGSDTVTISGDEVEFREAESKRLRAGARFSWAAGEQVRPYIGAYYDREFGGKVKATVNGDAINAPDLKGGTGVGEIGVTIKPSRTRHISLDVGVQGYTGRREGVTGSLQVRFEF
jgi:hypothetical protein